MFVVTLPSSAAATATAFAERAAREGATYLELRGDLTPQLQPFDCPLPVIVAPRGHDLAAILSSKRMTLAYLDLELDETCAAPSELPCIRSFHDHAAMPPVEHLRELACTLRVGAAVTKIAVAPQEPADLLALNQLRHELAQNTAVVVTAMGPLAKADRLLGVVDNAWTYCALTPDSASAPGQLLLADHLELGLTVPRLFAVLGGPEMQSASPLIHDCLFKSRHLPARYCAMPTADLEASFRSLHQLGFEGFSVTSPYKTAVLDLVDHVDKSAAGLGTLNTLHRRDGQWWGWQKDLGGLVAAHEDLRNAELAVIVGSGGVVPAMIAALQSLLVQRIVVVARNQNRRTELAEQFGISSLDLSELGNLEADVLLWTLPLDLELTLPQARAAAQAIDLRYGRETGFMTAARKLGYQVHDGLALLLAQALLQFEVFCHEPAQPSDLQLLQSLFAKETNDHGQ